MPIYDYECEAHGSFEAFRPLAERQSAPCPDCGAAAEQRITAVRFKLNPASGDFPTATDRWANRKEKANWDDLQRLGLRGSRKTIFGA